VIRRQFVEVEFDGSEGDAVSLQHRLLMLCQDELSPVLERVLDRLVPAQEHWSIDRLDIDAGSLAPESLEGLVKAVVLEVERQLQDLVPRFGSTRLSSLERKSELEAAMARVAELRAGPVCSRTQSQSVRQAFLYFLESGVLPWWFRLAAGKRLEDVIREMWQAGLDREAQPQYFARILGESIGSASVRKRLVRQFSPDFLSTLLSSSSIEVASSVREIFTQLRQQGIAARTAADFSDQIWETAFVSALARERVTPETLIAESLKAIPSGMRQQHSTLLEWIKSIWPRQDGGKAVEEAVKASDIDNPRDEIISRLNLEEGVFVDCAGVVLLHPFLARFFEAVGIAEGDKLLQAERALCLLHYLATGLRLAPEYELLLAKVLCNVPLDAPVDSRIEISAAEEEEAAALLSAVIRHWDALGNTSLENLRGSFLVRPGKLAQRYGEYLLQVEQRSYDVLLDRLPWGLGLVQLPWMQRILWVEWKS
jgi:hypothetical protein